MKKELLKIEKIGNEKNRDNNIGKDYLTFEYYDEEYEEQIAKIFKRPLLYKDERTIEKKLNYISSVEDLQHVLNIQKLLYDNEGVLVGYTYGDANQMPLSKYLFAAKNKKIEILKELRILISIAKFYGITYGAFDNIDNFAVTDHGIIISNPDNFKVKDMDFRNVTPTIDYFRFKTENNENLDEYEFNIFTMLFYQKYIGFNYAKDGLKMEGLPYRFDTKENRKILDKTLHLNKDYTDDVFIDNIKKGLF